MKVTIIQADIDNGQRDHATRDPIAIALQRQGFRNASVGTGTITFGKSVRRMSDAANRFRKAFDARRRVRPGVLDIVA